ncbi:hypothetical protein AAGW04_18295 [Pectobacterium aroidearum]|uniref:hypothetical protein n=1 Tax=Pectobacterium aroidearum TaxID=1201031 RepID=UPI003158EF48
MKTIVGLFCLALSLVLAGCNLTHQSTELTKENIRQPKDVIRFNTLILSLRKSEANTDWRTILHGWEPKKIITVVNGDGQKILAQIASNRGVTISNKGKTSSATTDKAPVPFSLQEQVQIGDSTNSYTVDMLLIPAITAKTEPMTLTVDMHIQVPQGDLSLSQVLSIPQRHSILVAHALNDNDLQVIIITPEISTEENI